MTKGGMKLRQRKTGKKHRHEKAAMRSDIFVVPKFRADVSCRRFAPPFRAEVYV